MKPIRLPNGVKNVRLLPVVIFAAAALLLFKGVGLVTNGGYLFVGVDQAIAAGGGKKAEPAPTTGATMNLPTEPTLTDINPTLTDTDPTLGQKKGASDHGKSSDHGTPAAGEGEHGTGGGTTGTEGETGHGDPATPATDAAHGEKDPAATGHGEEAPCVPGTDEAGNPTGCKIDSSQLPADAVPLIRDADGNMVPIGDAAGTGSETAVLERLRTRRTELDSREEELNLRAALVEAAEKRIEERTAALAALEKRITAMVDEKKAIEDESFASVVAMYQTMKPKEAAGIFDRMEIGLLVRVARAIPPRKMAPILAKMDPRRAQELTSAMAVEEKAPTIDLVGEDLSKLPQIIGQ